MARKLGSKDKTKRKSRSLLVKSGLLGANELRKRMSKKNSVLLYC